MTCTQFTLANFNANTRAEEFDTEANWVGTKIQRVSAGEELTDADIEANYQTYLEADIWLDMVAALATDPTSSEWQALLEALDIPPVNPVPQPLELFSPATE